MAAVFPIDTSQPWVNNGVTYVYNAETGSWQAVGSTATENLQDLEDRVDAIEAGGIDSGLSYMLQTNSITGGGEPAIDLVDSDDGFSNVKIEGTNGIKVTSNSSSIIIDGSDVQAIADLDDYYTKTEVDSKDKHLQDQVDELLVTKGEASVYTLNEIGITVGIRQGDFFVDQAVVADTSFIALAPEDDNGKQRPLGQVGDILEIVAPSNRAYRYEITTAADGVAGVVFELGSDPTDSYIPGTTYTIFIYPQNKTTASIDYVDSSVAGKADKTYVDNELNSKVGKSGDSTVDGKIILSRTRTDSSANSLLIKGRIGGEEGKALLKDYQRASSAAGDDYVAYYGSSEGDSLIMNRGYADSRYLSQATATSDYLKQQDASNTYVTKSYANSEYLRDGFQSSQTINFRTGGTSASPFKITNSQGGATLLKMDASGGKDSPVKFITDNGCNHQFVGKVKFERVADETQGFSIEGRKTDGSIGDLLHVYHNGGSVADAINYSGKITSNNNIVNKKYVDDAVGIHSSTLDDYLPLTGGDMEGPITMNGDPLNFRGNGLHFFHTNGDELAQLYRSGDTNLKLDIKGGKQFLITAKDPTGASRTFIGVTNTNSAGNSGEDYRVNIYHLAPPSADNHPATKKYVDDAISGTTSLLAIEDAEPDIHYGNLAPAEAGDGDLWVDTGNMRLLMRVNGAWVNPDRQESEVDLSPYQKIVSPPGRKFKKANATNPTTNGTFTYYETNGQIKLALNRRDAEGTKWLDINFTDNLNAPVLFRIIQWQNNTTHKTIRYGAIDKIVATDGGNVVCDVKYHSTNGSLTSGSNYFIIIGGLL